MNILPFFFFLLNIDGWIISESFVEEELALEREREGGEDSVGGIHRRDESKLNPPSNNPVNRG